MIGQAILLGCIAFIAQSEYALGTSLLSADYTYSAKVDKNLCTIFFLV